MPSPSFSATNTAPLRTYKNTQMTEASDLNLCADWKVKQVLIFGFSKPVSREAHDIEIVTTYAFDQGAPTRLKKNSRTASPQDEQRTP